MSRRAPPHRALIPLAALVLLALALPAVVAAGPPEGAIPAQLVDVIDGRTIEVSIAGRSQQILYAGIMTPQNAAPGSWAAHAANSVLLRSGPVYLVEDPALEGRTFGEALPRYVYLADGTFINAELVARGWAQPNEYVPGLQFAEQFRQLAAQAAERKAGFWSADPPTDGFMAYGMTASPATLGEGVGNGSVETGLVPTNTPVTVLGSTSDGKWLSVRLPSGTVGSVAASRVSMNLPASALIAAGNVPRPSPPASAQSKRAEAVICWSVIALALAASAAVLWFAEGQPEFTTGGLAIGVVILVALVPEAINKVAAGDGWWHLLVPAAVAILLLALLVRGMRMADRMMRENPGMMW